MSWRYTMYMKISITYCVQMLGSVCVGFVQTVFGSETERSRWRECVSYVNDHMGNAMGRMFVMEHFDETSKSTV